MGMKLSAFATGAGGLLTVVATAGMCHSLGWGRTPGQLLIGLLTLGLVVLVLGVMWRFEEQSRVWANRTETRLQTRRLQPLTNSNG